MPQPTSTEVHLDAILTDISVAWSQNQDEFVASKVFPTVNVAKQFDKFYRFGLEDWMRDDVKMRAPATESAGSGFAISKGTYSCDKWALHKDLSDEDKANADMGLQLDMSTTEYLTQQMMIRQEIAWASKFLSTTVGWTVGTQTALWSAAGATIIQDIQTAINTMLTNTGRRPNKLVVSYAVFSILKNATEIVERYKYTTSMAMTTSLIAQVIGVDEILVMGGVQNTAKEGATKSLKQIGNKSALLVYSPPTPMMMTPAAGYNFNWTGLTGVGGFGTASSIGRIQMPTLKAERLEIEAAWDFQVISTDLGVYWDAAVA